MTTAQAKFTVPSQITVGFQERQGTYTGKLAYVIYKDAKGVLRKEKSWQSWRDKTIEPKEFENVPTSGFVLNKKVGDYGGWFGGRHAWVRIYDPRDFEFEISVQNLLFILEETSAIKGKGLEGEFVYAWDGTELVLVPVSSQEYKSSVEFTALQTEKVSVKDMKEGCTYLTKDTQTVMYLGRQDYYELTTGYYPSYTRHLKKTRCHVFVSTDGQSRYWTQTGFTKLAKRLSEEPSPLFAEEFEKFKKSIHGSAPAKIVARKLSLSEEKFESYYYGRDCYYKENGKFYPASVQKHYPYNNYYNGYRTDMRFYLHVNSDPITISNGVELEENRDHHRPHKIQESELTIAQIQARPLYSLVIQNEAGTLIHLNSNHDENDFESLEEIDE